SINLEGWKKRFGNIVDFHDVSAEEGTGTADLREFIKGEICKLPHIGDTVAKNWLKIRESLQKLDENYIPYVRYKAICKEFELNEKEAEHLGDYFHDLGVFLHFKKNPILRNTVFLKPEWATNAVYKVTDDKKVKENGKFRFDDLAEIWKDRNEFPEEKFVDLLELMKSFELCFELPNRLDYIIPELLPANQPPLDWNYDNNLRFKYHYDFMPAGVMTRFIVTTHDLIDGDLYWKDGLVLQREKTRALVIKTDPRRIEVWIDGDDKKTLLGMIRRHMDYINKPFSNLEVEEMVPCVCIECEKNEDPYFFPYKNLIKAREKGTAQIQCQENFEDVSIERLISGIESRDFQRTLIEPERKDIKIFLASSGELKKEREQIQLFIGEENSKLRRENIYLDLVVWEQLKQSFHGKRIQDHFNEKMLECDVVIALFFKKVGEFTKEEFDIAYKNFQKGKKPKYLYVYFKSEKVDIDEIDEEVLKISKLKKEIAEAEQIYSKFISNEDLILQIKKQLELIIPEITKK
ncbi:hypothetical protein IIA28_14100, partial [candidate division KSB1 bacterium]|nr:hypothetical protein [candidate division KSB1 bacterium]